MTRALALLPLVLLVGCCPPPQEAASPGAVAPAAKVAPVENAPSPGEAPAEDTPTAPSQTPEPTREKKAEKHRPPTVEYDVPEDANAEPGPEKQVVQDIAETQARVDRVTAYLQTPEGQRRARAVAVARR